MTRRQGSDSVFDQAMVSRRTCVSGGVAAASVSILGGFVLIPVPAVADADKISKKLASYQDEPKGKSSMCAVCKYFIKPASCVIVEGTISPQGWCQRFDKRSEK